MQIHLKCYEASDIGPVRSNPGGEHRGGRPFAILPFGPFELYVTEAGEARQLLTAAAAALHILNPDLAQEAVAKLVADLLDTAFPDDPGLEGIIRAGQAVDVSHLRAPFAPDTAQPEDIPLPPQCSRCQASSSVVPMVLEDGDWHCHNSAACGRRAQDRAKASAR